MMDRRRWRWIGRGRNVEGEGRWIGEDGEGRINYVEGLMTIIKK